MYRWAAAGLVWLTGLGWARADLPPLAFTPEEQARLALGEVVVARRAPSDGHGLAAQASLLIEAAPDEVWPVINDCPHYKDFMPRHKASAELLREPGHSRCHVEIALPFPMRDLWSETDALETSLPGGGYRRAGTLLRGTYRRLQTSWDLLPQEHGTRTLVVYRIDVEPETSVPDALLRLGQESSLPDALRAVQRRTLERRAERSR